MPTLMLVLGVAAFLAAFPVLWWSVSGDRSGQGAVGRNLRSGNPVADLRQLQLDRSADERAVRPAMAALARRARRITPQGVHGSIDHRIVVAGAPPGWTLDRVLMAKVVGAPAGLAVGFTLLYGDGGIMRLAMVAAATALGWFGPDLLLKNKATKRRAVLTRELADTLDQMTISVEAGLGLDAAMKRVARVGTGPLASELLRTLQDMRSGMSRAEALRALVHRTDVPELRQFVSAVIQADSHGVPIARVLRIQSREQRTKRRQVAEEKAMKLPVKLLFPTVAFIFPAIFIVLLGPAMISIGSSL